MLKLAKKMMDQLPKAKVDDPAKTNNPHWDLNPGPTDKRDVEVCRASHYTMETVIF